MDERRKHAYRWLLYRAMLDIRPIGWLGTGWRERLNPFCWWSSSQRVRMAGGIADWLHNLAMYSALDFERFDEEWFWKDYLSLCAQYPLEHYRTVFEQELSPAE